MQEPFPRCTVYAQVLSGGELQSARVGEIYAPTTEAQASLIVHQRKRKTMNRTSIMAALVALLFVPFISSPADAYRSRHYRNHAATHHTHAYRLLSRQRTNECALTNDGQRICNTIAGAPAFDAPSSRTFAMADTGTIIGSRPAGCPHSYCGCGLRMYLGLSDVRLNLASNWARLFPRQAGPAPGLAAVRNHHVMYIESAAGNGQWLIRDYNSGGGLSRMHVRDVRGYVFVNPRAHTASRSEGATGSRRKNAPLVRSCVRGFRSAHRLHRGADASTACATEHCHEHPARGLP